MRIDRENMVFEIPGTTSINTKSIVREMMINIYYPIDLFWLLWFKGE
jgi:hypothetical protein